MERNKYELQREVLARKYETILKDFEDTNDDRRIAWNCYQQIIAACCESFGTVDILINNAGICKLNKVLDFGRADWDPMIDVNLTAPFELSHEAAKIMIPQNSGKIINI